MESLKQWRVCLVAFALLLVFSVPQVLSAAVTVKTVPVDPKNPTAPHFTYPLDATHEVTIVLGASVDLGGSTDAFTYSWHFGDGSPDTSPVSVTQPFDISVQHQYPASAAGGTIWTAVVTVRDTTTSTNYTGNYYVIQQANNLASRVDVAIDSGLWYLHQSMWHCNNGFLTGGVYNHFPTSGCGVTGVFGPNGIYGGWDAITFGCVFSPCYANLGYQAINASNVQAFEVNGHLETGPATDPYTEDVKETLARIVMLLGNTAVASKTYAYNVPGTSCPNGGTTPCNYTFDGNSNGQMVLASVGNQPMYQSGQIMDAIVASGTPNAVTYTGAGSGGGLPGINGQTYKDIIQDMADGYDYCQNTFSTGGAWGYNCLNQNYNDNSVSQWGAIGEIGAHSVFGTPIPSIITDASALWLTTDQCTSGGYTGAFGYSGPCYEPWGPFAVTPSGTVQLTMDKLGRGDTRWNQAETFYHDNFCNPTTNGAFRAPRQYTYGLFSFTKSMLLHSPGGVLSPITMLTDQPSGTNPIDWYSSVGPESGGADTCDGVAETLIKRQGVTGGPGGTTGSPNPSNPQGGFWTSHHSEFNGTQDPFETAWSIIMLRKTVFISCVNNLNGEGYYGGGITKPRIDLSWTGISGAASYNVLRGTVSGGPYTEVGNTTITAFADKTAGLLNGKTYYYVLQPLNNAGGPICQSNQATIPIPSKF
jgi:hypothetical protein